MSETTEPSNAPRGYDLIVVSDNADHRIAPKGGEAFLRHLAIGKNIRIVGEAVADKWVEVYGEPDVASHELFLIGPAPEGVISFARATIRFGLQGVALPFGGDRDVNFFFEISGTPYTDFGGRFKMKFKEILLARPDVLRQPHAGVRADRPVPEDELPKGKVRRERGTAKAGTRVEEF